MFRLVQSKCPNFPKLLSRNFGQTSKFVINETLSSTNYKIGSFAELKHMFPQDDVDKFAHICGDNNPLHVDVEFASESRFKGTIVHGILLSSLFSTLLGRTIRGSIYVSQSMKFTSPVHVGGYTIYHI
jgi:acyl dehydratase